MSDEVLKVPPPTVKEWKPKKELPPLKPNSKKKSWRDEQRQREKDEERRAAIEDALEDLRYEKAAELYRRRAP